MILGRVSIIPVSKNLINPFIIAVILPAFPMGTITALFFISYSKSCAISYENDSWPSMRHAFFEFNKATLYFSDKSSTTFMQSSNTPGISNTCAPLPNGWESCWGVTFLWGRRTADLM